MSSFLMYASDFSFFGGIALGLLIYLREWYLYAKAMNEVRRLSVAAGGVHEVKIDNAFLVRFLADPAALLSNGDPIALIKAKEKLIGYRKRLWRIVGAAIICAATGFLGKIVLMIAAVWAHEMSG